MNIKYYNDGAVVTFEKKEYMVGEKIGKIPADKGGVSIKAESDMDKTKQILAKLALFAVLNKVNPHNCASRNFPGADTNGIEVRSEEGNPFTYEVGDVSGSYVNEIDFDFIEYAAGFARGVQCATGKTDIWGAEKEDEAGKLTAPEKCYEPGSRMYVYGGADSVGKLGHYVKGKIKDARIYKMNGHFYVVGTGEKPDNSIRPEYIMEHGRVYSGRKKTDMILSLCID